MTPIRLALPVAAAAMAMLAVPALTTLALGAIACVPQDGGQYGDGDYYADGGYSQADYRNRDRHDEGDRYDDGDRTDEARDRTNSCRRAYNGVCDEGRYGGTNKCDDGTDTTDCRGYYSLDRDHGPNSCRAAYNGVCDEGRYGGSNRCTDGTDTADCSSPGRRKNNWPFN